MKTLLIFNLMILALTISISAYSQSTKTSKWDRRVSKEAFKQRIIKDSELKSLDKKEKTNLKIFVPSALGAIGYAAVLQNKYGSEFSDIPNGHKIGVLGLTAFAIYSILKAGFTREKKVKLYYTKFPREEETFIQPSKSGVGFVISF